MLVEIRLVIGDRVRKQNSNENEFAHNPCVDLKLVDQVQIGMGGLPRSLLSSLFKHSSEIESVANCLLAKRQAGFNPEVNQDKETVQTYLRNLGFSQSLTSSLDEASRLYEEGGNAFTLKASMGHLRSFLENLQKEAMPAVQTIADGEPPIGWGPGLAYLRRNQIISEAEDKFAGGLYGLISDSAVHPLRSSPKSFPFQVTDEGVLFLKETDTGTDAIRIAARVDVVAKTRDDANANWGRLLNWRDDENKLHRWPMPMELLASDAGAVRARLLSEGLPFTTTNTRLREKLVEYLQSAPVERRVRCVARITLPEPFCLSGGRDQLIAELHLEHNHATSLPVASMGPRSADLFNMLN